MADFGLVYFGMADERQGIVHIIGPEQGFTLPGCTTVCGDSHTATHGAFGAMAFGIGTSEVEHVLATQTLPQTKAQNMLIRVDGELDEGVTSKDIILHICGVIGTAGGTGSTIEFAGSAIESLSMEARMSISNMAIEAGARAGVIAPDQITFDYLKGRPMCPDGEDWDKAVEYWLSLQSDEGAKYDNEVIIDAKDIAPTVTWGTSPQDTMPVDGFIPKIDAPEHDEPRQAAVKRSLEYIGLEGGEKIEGQKIDKVFIGSCTNGRIEDMRNVAAVAMGRKVADGIDAMVVPGSGLVKVQDSEVHGIQQGHVLQPHPHRALRILLPVVRRLWVVVHAAARHVVAISAESPVQAVLFRAQGDIPLGELAPVERNGARAEAPPVKHWHDVQAPRNVIQPARARKGYPPRVHVPLPERKGWHDRRPAPGRRLDKAVAPPQIEHLLGVRDTQRLAHTAGRDAQASPRREVRVRRQAAWGG